MKQTDFLLERKRELEIQKQKDEQERKKQLEFERQLERQRQVEQQREEERRKLFEQREVIIDQPLSTPLMHRSGDHVFNPHKTSLSHIYAKETEIFFLLRYA